MVLAPSVAGLFKWRQFEPEVILLAVGLVLALLAFILRRRGVARRAGFARRSRHRLEMGPAVCSGNGAALAPAPQADERLVAGGRDVRAGERKMGVLVWAVDSSGATIDFLLAKRDAAAAERFLAKALGGENSFRSRGSSTATSTPLPPAISVLKPQAIWPTTANTAPCSISIMSWNRITGRSSVGSTRASISARSVARTAPSPVTKRFI